jgi:hypothetical protein
MKRRFPELYTSQARSSLHESQLLARPAPFTSLPRTAYSRFLVDWAGLFRNRKTVAGVEKGMAALW